MDRTTALHRFERKSRDRICMYNRLQGQLQYYSIVLLIYYKIYQKLLDSGFELSHFFVELEVARLRKYFADTSVVSQFLFLCTQFTFKVSKKKYEFDNLPKLFQFEAQTFAATKIRSFYGTVKMQKSSHFVSWSFCPSVLVSRLVLQLANRGTILSWLQSWCPLYSRSGNWFRLHSLVTSTGPLN